MTANANIYQMVIEAMNSVPVDLDGLARRMGINVIRRPYEDDFCGSIECNSDGKFTIELNSTHADTRQRFTLAHEIGHFVLHRHLLGNGTSDNRAYRTMRTKGPFNTDIQHRHEVEANKFAANLIMPKALVQSVREKLGNPSTLQIASLFGVSEKAMAIRLERINRDLS